MTDRLGMKLFAGSVLLIAFERWQLIPPKKEVLWDYYCLSVEKQKGDTGEYLKNRESQVFLWNFSYINIRIL